MLQAISRDATSTVVYALALCRIALCLFPQNDWFSANPSLAWGISRNIPFVILGGMIAYELFRGRNTVKGFKFAWLAVTLSFLFYIPVVLFADAIPIIGMLMLPKTACYVWLVLMGERGTIMLPPKKYVDNLKKEDEMNELRKIRLTGDYFSLNILERIFANEDLTVFSEVHCNQKMFYLKSYLFENLNEKELRNEGEKLVKKINSTFSFVKGNYIPVKIEDVYIGDCGYMTFEDHITLRDDLYIVENGKERDLDEDVILYIFTKMENDNLLHQILTLSLEKGKDWVNLYKILELFKAHNIDITDRKWITVPDFNSLKHTANSPDAKRRRSCLT